LEKWSHHYFNSQYLEYSDLVITPLFVALIFFLINLNRERLLGINNPLRSYLIPALSLKIFGALASGLVYQFYYGGGDTMDFYTSASYVAGLCFDNFSDFLGMLNSSPFLSDPTLTRYDFLEFASDPSTWTVIRIITVLDIFSFDSYPVISIYFSLFSLYASWKFLTLICQLYPQPELRRKFAYCIFYIPSVIFWGSGIFKDTLTLSGLYLFTVYIYAVVIKRQIKPSNFVWIALGLYLMVKIRLFFLIILIPCLMLWFFAEYRDKLIKSRFLKTASFPILMLITIGIITYGLKSVMGGNSELSSKALTEKAEGFQSWHSSLGGSAYDLGIVDYSTGSLLRAIPLGINVAFFRPYLWETHSLFQMIAALQSLFFLYFTVRTVLRCGFSIFLILATDPLMLFSLSFSLLYGFVAGFTSYNFGALDRYKIPALPFFMITLVLVNFYKDQDIKKASKKSLAIDKG
jgi:hypothetical protein